MLKIGNRRTALGLCVCIALIGCTAKTNVSATGNAPAQYTHIFVTAQEIWFNTDATAGPDDTSWKKYPLTSPVTIDLVSETDGTLGQLTTGLAVPAGTYNQVRLIPVDSSATLAASASSLQAKYNFEVDYVDSSNKSVQLPIELQNPDKGIGIASSFTVATSLGSLAGLSSSTSSTTSSTSSSSSTTTPTTQVTTGFFTPTPTTTTTNTTTPTTTTTNTSTRLTPLTMAINIDASRDLAFFAYNGTTAILLNPHATASNNSALGAVQGTITPPSSVTSTTGHLPIQVTAEALSADGTRHVVVNSAPVTTSGSFVLYPLPANSSSSPTNYDLVIHGPGIATVIVKAVPVKPGDPSTTTPVSIGTIAPRSAGSYTVNLNNSTPVPAGALVGFYQTLPLTGEVPYVIEQFPIDPFSRTFATDQAISAESVDFGTFVSGSNVALSVATPSEGAATYRVGATAPLFTDADLTTTVRGAAGSANTVPVLPTLTVASGATASSISINVSLATANKYNQGELILSQGGAIVATASLNTILTQSGGGTLAISGLPGGSSSTSFPAALYYVSVRTWSTTNPSTPVNRESYPAPADLRNGSVSGYPLSID